jgi:GTPase Era involved in 16S rRNA processing
VGNKADLEEEREVSSEDAEAFAAEQGMMYIETSAKTAHNVRKIMEDVASRLPEGAGVREEDSAARRENRRAGGRAGAGAVTVDGADAPAGKSGGCC